MQEAGGLCFYGDGEEEGEGDCERDSGELVGKIVLTPSFPN